MKCARFGKITIDGVEKPLAIKACYGLSAYPESADSLVEMINVTDAMLYRAKNNGKNRIEVYRPMKDGHSLKIVASS